MSVSTILLIPAAGDPHGLLREGPCGARPPTLPAVREDAHPCAARCWRVGAPGVFNEDGDCTECGRTWPMRPGLVLAHDGKPVVEGCDRASRCFTQAVYGGRVQGGGSAITAGTPLDDIRAWADFLTDARGLGGRFVLLDAEGREVAP